ncbi:MAG TPA: MauE/DoxX family redox-associated membrane protein [Acidimicrobiia bacterium]
MSKRLASRRVEGAFYLVSALLLVSGGNKLFDPGPTAGALRAAGLPGPRRGVQALALTEVVVGAGALAFSGTWFGWGVAILYVGFLGFVVNALIRRLPIGSCGCFGKSDTPPSVGHLLVNLAAAVTGVIAALEPARPLPDVMLEQPAWGLPYLVFVGIGVYLLYLLLSQLPALLAHRLEP